MEESDFDSSPIDSTQLARTFLEEYRLGQFIIDEWEDSIDSKLCKMIESLDLSVTDDEGRICKMTFKNFKVLGSKNNPSSENSIVECRRTLQTYSCKILASVTLSYPDSDRKSVKMKKQHLFSIPLMTGSKYCELSNLSPSEVLSFKECPVDSHGYYIMNGKEKAANMKKKVRTGESMIIDDTEKRHREENRKARAKVNIQSPRSTIVAKMICNRYVGTSAVCIHENEQMFSKIIETDLSFGIAKDLDETSRSNRKKIQNVPINVFAVIDILGLAYEKSLVKKAISILREWREERLSEIYLEKKQEIEEILEKNKEICEKFPIKIAKGSISKEEKKIPSIFYTYQNSLIKRRNEKRVLQGISELETEIGQKIEDSEKKEKEEKVKAKIFKGYRKIFFEFSSCSIEEKCNRISSIISQFFSGNDDRRQSFESYIISTSENYGLQCRTKVSSKKDKISLPYLIIQSLGKEFKETSNEIIFEKTLEQFFPEPMIPKTKFYPRIQALSSMVCQLIEYFIGHRPLGNKNSFETTQIDAGGRSLCGLIIGPFLRERKNNYAKTPPSYSKVLDDLSTLTESVKSRFVTGRWVASQEKSDTPPMSEDIKRESANSSYFSITKIITSSSEEGVQAEVRFQNGSHKRRTCCYHTPDNNKAGLVTYPGVSVVISKDRDVKKVLRAIRKAIKEKNFIKKEKSVSHSFSFSINSVPIGWISSSEEIFSKMKKIKFSENFFDVSFCRYEKYSAVKVFCDYGRFVTPLLVVDLKSGVAELRKKKLEGCSIKTLLLNEAIEFVDASEESFLVVSPEPELLSMAKVTADQYQQICAKLARNLSEIRGMEVISKNSNKIHQQIQKNCESIDILEQMKEKADFFISSPESLSTEKENLFQIEDDFLWKVNIGGIFSFIQIEKSSQWRSTFRNFFYSCLSSIPDDNEEKIKFTKSLKSISLETSILSFETFFSNFSFTSSQKREIVLKVISLCKEVLANFSLSPKTRTSFEKIAKFYEFINIPEAELKRRKIIVEIAENKEKYQKFDENIDRLVNTDFDVDKARKEDDKIVNQYRDKQEEIKKLSHQKNLYEKYRYFKVPTHVDTHGASSQYIKTENEITHSELAPVLINGISSGLTPYLNHNPATRIFYQTGQYSQLSGLYTFNESDRFDSVSNKLMAATPSPISTEIGRALKKDQFPESSMVRIAFMNDGATQEDGLIINQASIDRGLFTTFGRKTITIEYKSNISLRKNDKVASHDLHLYSRISDSGVIYEGAFVNRGDVLVCFFDSKTKKFSSYKAKVDDVGVVERVEVMKEGQNVVLIKVRKVNIINIGDKLLAAPANKSTLNQTCPEVDMPFNRYGTPDMIVSPVSVLGRVTIGAFMQTIVGSLTMQIGSTADATVFKDFNYHLVASELVRHGFSYSGKELFTNGITGEEMECDIFTGLSPYSALKHLSSKKIQYRAQGDYDKVTGQGTGGREKGTRGSAQKFGEYELSGIDAHGASSIIQDALSRSNLESIEICATCGMNAVSKEDSQNVVIFYCPRCKKSGIPNSQIITKKMPRSMIVVEHYLAAFGIKTSKKIIPSFQNLDQENKDNSNEGLQSVLSFIRMKMLKKAKKEKRKPKFPSSKRVLKRLFDSFFKKDSSLLEDEIKVKIKQSFEFFEEMEIIKIKEKKIYWSIPFSEDKDEEKTSESEK